jgi:hypothetical protein
VCRSLLRAYSVTETVSERRRVPGRSGRGDGAAGRCRCRHVAGPRARHRAVRRPATCTPAGLAAGGARGRGAGLGRSARRPVGARRSRATEDARARAAGRPRGGVPRGGARERWLARLIVSRGGVPRGGARERWLARLIVSAVLSCNVREAEKLMLFAIYSSGRSASQAHVYTFRSKQTQPHGHAPARRPSHGFRVVAIPPPVVGPPPTRPNPAAFAASYLSL